MRTIDHILGGLQDKPSRSLDSAYKRECRAEDEVVTYFVMTISMGILGLIILIKLFI